MVRSPAGCSLDGKPSGEITSFNGQPWAYHVLLAVRLQPPLGELNLMPLAQFCEQFFREQFNCHSSRVRFVPWRSQRTSSLHLLALRAVIEERAKSWTLEPAQLEPLEHPPSVPDSRSHSQFRRPVACEAVFHRAWKPDTQMQP